MEARPRFPATARVAAVAYLYYKKLWVQPALRLETLSGIKNYTLIEKLSDGHYWFEAEIGKPRFASDEVPVRADTRLENVIDRRIPVADQWVTISAVNVGNPVVCTFVDNFDPDWRGFGQQLECHEAFPEKRQYRLCENSRPRKYRAAHLGTRSRRNVCVGHLRQRCRGFERRDRQDRAERLGSHRRRSDRGLLARG